MPNPVKCLGYIKCYKWSSPRPAKNPSSPIRYNCQKISSWLKKRKTILEIKKVTFSLVDQQSYYFASFSKTILTTERRLRGW